VQDRFAIGHLDHEALALRHLQYLSTCPAIFEAAALELAAVQNCSIICKNASRLQDVDSSWVSHTDKYTGIKWNFCNQGRDQLMPRVDAEKRRPDYWG
jgi:hypothetical protein